MEHFLSERHIDEQTHYDMEEEGIGPDDFQIEDDGEPENEDDACYDCAFKGHSGICKGCPEYKPE